LRRAIPLATQDWPGGAAPNDRLVTNPDLADDCVGDLQTAMGSAEGQAAGADVATFASGGATLMIAEA